MSARAPLVLILVASAACGGGDDGGASFDAAPPDACPALAIDNLVVVENPANVLSATIEWDTAEPATTGVDVVCGADVDITFDDATATTDHRVFVMGLVEGASCQVTARSTATCDGSQTMSYTVSDLPDFVPGFTVATEAGTIEPGWTILNLNGLTANPPFLVVIVDEQGRVRWYHRRNTTRPSGSTDVRVTDDGVLIAGSPAVAAAMVDWDGAVLWEKSLGAHHEFLPLGGDVYAYLIAQTTCPDGFSSDTLVEWNQMTDTETYSWRLCDHYTPPEARDDWSHANAIEPFPGENAYLLSVRDQNNLVKINRTTNSIEWVLGDNGDFTLAASDKFVRQHAAEILPNGNILLFDNGQVGVREYSRAIELSYDTGDSTAEVVWEYRRTPDLFDAIWGDVDRLPGGNTLVTFGSDVPAVRSRIVEVTTAGTEVWQLIFDLGWGVYRSQRIAEPALARIQP